MQRAIKKYGDRLQVVGLSVDYGFGGDSDYVRKRESEIRKQGFWTWPNMYDPQGFSGIMRRLNISGYGLTLLAPDGMVLGKGIRMEEVERLLDRVLARRAGRRD